MKAKITLLAVILVGLLGGSWFYQSEYGNHPSASITPSTILGVSTLGSPSPSPVVQVGKPKTIIIPKLNINAPIEEVGLDSQKRMDVPKHAADAGWYDLGVKPGEVGNAVIDGHLDTVTGAPAIFYYLKQLAPGDQIQIIDENNKTWTFKITDKKVFDFDKVPLQDIFGPSNSEHLNLITCQGQFNQNTRNYSQRTVIYSDLVKQ